MIHWQTFLQTHKGLPLHEIIEKYNRVLIEHNEQRM